MGHVDFDVCIVGGGLAGLTLAAALGKSAKQFGLRVGLLDHLPLSQRLNTSFDIRTTALSLATRRVLEALGLWDELDANSSPIKNILIRDRESASDMVFDARDVGEQAFGWIVQNQALRAVLADAIETSPVVEIAPGLVLSSELSTHSREIGLTDGRQISAHLIVGADGKTSALRSLARIPVARKTYDHHALVCTLRHEHPHEGWALEMFLPEGPFATLPLQDPHCSAIVWSHTQARSWLNLSPADFEKLIAPQMAPTHGAAKLENMANGKDSRAVWPLSLCVAQRYIAGRLALVSDAARSFHPIAGQAFNLGMRDVAMLAELIHDHAALGLELGMPDLLKAYQRRRRFDGALMAGSTNSLVSLFGSKKRPTRMLRNLGFRAVENIPGLKPTLMRHAMGTFGPSSRLTSGLSL